jgi:hypothetical protein
MQAVRVPFGHALGWSTSHVESRRRLLGAVEEDNYAVYGVGGQKRGIVWRSADGVEVWHYSVAQQPLHPIHEEYATFLEAALMCLVVSAA